MEHPEFVAALWNPPKAQAEPRAEEPLRMLELWYKRGEYIEAMSYGVKQKMALVAALLREPTPMLLISIPVLGADRFVLVETREIRWKEQPA